MWVGCKHSNSIQFEAVTNANIILASLFKIIYYTHYFLVRDK
jgi:hypothetical protein